MARPDRLTLAAFVIIVVFFGVNFVAVRFSNRELAPFWGAGARFLVAAIVLFGIVAIRRIPLPRGRALVGAVLFGALAFGANFAFLYWALVKAGAAIASVVFALVPLLTLAMAAAIGLETLRTRTVLGALLALAGILIAFRDQLSLAVPLSSLLAVAGGATVAAASGIVVKRFPRSHPLATSAVGMIVGAAMLLALSFVAGETPALPTLRATWLAFLWLVMSSCIAFVLMVWVLSRWSASATAYAGVLAPLVTMVVAAAIASEPLTLVTALAALVVIAGSALGIGRPAAPAAAPAVGSAPAPPAR